MEFALRKTGQWYTRSHLAYFPFRLAAGSDFTLSFGDHAFGPVSYIFAHQPEPAFVPNGGIFKKAT
jgi:hypothetical protein